MKELNYSKSSVQMIQLPSRNLEITEQQVLDDLQKKIDAEVLFDNKAAKAQSLWDSKGGKAGKDAFKIIGATLLDMCIYVGVCNYCEQSEANDIEHIHPKSFFPAHTFNWENYILACKQCNSGQKLDKGYVLNVNDDLVALVRGTEPINNRIAFINIRTEDPEDFMILNDQTFKFDIFTTLPNAAQKKAEGTLKVLELNERDTLIAARKSAAKHYYETLERLIRLLSAPDKNTFEEQLTPYEDRFDMTKSLQELKDEVTISFKKYISTYQHPSVWRTIKLIQSKTHPKWITLFNQLPSALNW